MKICIWYDPTVDIVKEDLSFFLVKNITGIGEKIEAHSTSRNASLEN